MSADAFPANNTNNTNESAATAPAPANQPASGGPGLQGGEPSGTGGGRGGRQQHNRNRRPPAQRYQGGDGGDASGGNPQQDHRRQHGHHQQQPYRHDQRHHHEGGGGGGGRRQRADEGGSSTTDFAPRNAKFLRKHHVKDRSDHGGVQMTGRVHECLICCQRSDLFGVGACLHPACMECSIRMRICGESDTCPQCRSPIEVMYFVSSPNNWESFEFPRLTVPHRDADKYRIRFENDYAAQCYESYMAHNCHVCQKRGNPASFGTFGALRHHIGQEHELSFCHICCENLNVLTKDRKTYSKTELQQHMQGKNRGEDGFRGHPKCLFCEQRFFDDEQQYRHLRREHYFCQICDTDGAANVFYARAQQLQRHYEKEHFPCRDPDCVSMGIVFRSKLDLELHEKSHGGEGSRRPIPLDIQFSTGRAHGPMRPGAQHGDVVTSVPGGSARIALVQTPQQAAPVRPENFRIVPSALTQVKQQRIVRSAAPQFAPQGTEFPTLSGGGMTGQREPVPYGAPPGWRQQVQQARAAQAPPITMSSGEQFPSLGPSATSGSKPAGSNTVWGKAKTQDLFKNVAPPRPRPSAQEQQKRKPVIPTPDIWPEHIRKKMEARAAGLPVEEEQDPILRAEEHFTAEEKAKRAAKKKAKKQVAASAVTNKLEETPLPSTSKFETLGAFDEGADEEEVDDKTGWWSAQVKAGKTTAQQTTTLRPTSDDFVQIDTGSIPVTLRSVAASIAPQKENIPVAKPSSKEPEQQPKDGKPVKGKALDHWEDDLSLYDLNDPTPPPKAEEQSEVEKALQNWEDDLSLYDLSDPSDPDGGAQPSLSFTNIVSNMFGWTFGGAGAGPQPQMSKGQKKRQKQKAKEAATNATSSGATKSKSEEVKTGNSSPTLVAEPSRSDADQNRAWSSNSNDAPPGFNSKFSSQDYPSLSSNGGPPPPGFSPNRSSKNTPPPPGFEKNNEQLEID